MSRRLKLFEAAGLELEYMIVDRNTGSVAPVVDRLIRACRGRVAADCTIGECEASNELAAHVFELKVPEPVSDFDLAERRFVDALRRANALLNPLGFQLLPGPMHPTMNPKNESGLWRHGGRRIYEFYDATFDCRRHGWLNLQSCHLNLPFANDREFGLLHAAVILLLPLLPALTAGSPFKEGRRTGWLDERLRIYARNQSRFPQITGKVVPEAVFTESDYRRIIHGAIEREIKPIDPQRVLRTEWVNSRGAIARFDRGAIEIRVLDVQECPRADMAIARLVFETLRELVNRHGEGLFEHVRSSSTGARRRQLMALARDGFAAPLQLKELGPVFNLPRSARTAADFWRHVHRKFVPASLSDAHNATIDFILRRGNLATRLIRLHERAGPSRNRRFPEIIGELADCLAENRLLGRRLA